MAALEPSITPELEAFIAAQPVFFVGSAPLSPRGHVNVSPKGLSELRVLAPLRVAYLDLTGSGNETAAHLLENGRVTIMFCAFAGPPKILRLYGTGRPVRPGDSDWAELAEKFPPQPGIRQIIVADIDRVQTSCGFGVPRMALQSQRDQLTAWAEKKGEDALAVYRQNKNARSIDGLPAW